MVKLLCVCHVLWRVGKSGAGTRNALVETTVVRGGQPPVQIRCAGESRAGSVQK